jgi:mitochondrial fission protein ELM1
MRPPLTDSWVLHDGAAGNRRQALALAGALDLPGHEAPLQPDWRARLLAPRRFPGAASSLGSSLAGCLAASPPQLVIGCGRAAALGTRLARAAGHRTVQILDPRLDPAHWDLVIAPEHDGLRGANVVTLVGSLHPVDAHWLEAMRARFVALEALPRPCTAVLLGGPTGATAFDRAALDALCARLDQALATSGGSLVVCGSRRTPDAWETPLRAWLARAAEGTHRLWLRDRDGENPYAGALAWADRIVVSPDSVNMVSEACATTAPVYVAEPGRASGRVRRFLDGLAARGRIRAQDDVLAPFEAEPLRETPRVAAIVRERLGLPAP